ncbi:MAG: O-antigen ligase family protein [Pseudomonadota bacterium]
MSLVTASEHHMPLPIPLAPSALLALAFVLMPFGRMVEIPLLALSIWGLVCLLRGIRVKEVRVPVPLGLFAVFFIAPMLIALPDAVLLEKSLVTTIGSLRFPLFVFAVLWMAHAATDPQRYIDKSCTLLGAVVALLLLIWCLDGTLQAVSGQNLLGYGRGEGYINGLFGEDDNIKLGITVALLMPMGLVFLEGRQQLGAAFLLLLLTLGIVLLSGKRGAWIVAAVELLVLSTFFVKTQRLNGKHLSLGAVVLLVMSTLVFLNSDWVNQRSASIARAATDPSYAALNEASGKRLPIWTTAVAIAKDNWVNGVGPRGFRFAYPTYAQEGDKWSAPAGAAGGSRASHAHQLLLDLAAETGSFGVVSYLATLYLLIRLWLRADASQRRLALPFAASLSGMLFPLNTHPGWYSSWSASFYWLLLGLYLLAISRPSALIADGLKPLSNDRPSTEAQAKERESAHEDNGR